MNDPALAIAERAARNAAAVIADAARDLKRLATFSKERGEIVSQADSAGVRRAGEELIGVPHPEPAAKVN